MPLFLNHFTGLSAVLIYTLLPGVALIPRWCARTRLEHLGLICALSIAVNAFALMIFAILGIYSPMVATVWAIFLVLFSGTIYTLSHLAYRKTPSSPGSLIDSSTHNAEQVYPDRMEKFLHISVYAILIVQAYKTWSLPFYTWDAIASWNRWARNYLLVPDYFHTAQFFGSSPESVGINHVN